MIKAIFFDLDYTLYDMRQYLRGAYRQVAEEIAQICGRDADVLYDSLWATWERVGTDYGYLFTDWLTDEVLSEEHLQVCIDAFHAYRPQSLTFYPGVLETLKTLRRNFMLGLITDGDVQMQQSKTAVLELEDLFDVIVYAKALNTSKPDPLVFETALEQAGVAPGEAVYIGDRPACDLVGARRVGMYAVRAMTGEFKHAEEPESGIAHHRIETIPALLPWLDSHFGGSTACEM